MKYENIKVNDNQEIHFFSKTSSRPAANLNLDGGLIEVNDTFRKLFHLEERGNIKEILDETTIEMWDEFTKIAKKNGRISFYLPIRLASNKLHTIEISFIYCDHANQVTALFNIPPNQGNEAGTRYLNAFLKSDNFMILVNEQGIIRNVNERSSAFFNLPPEFFIGKSIDVLINLFPGHSQKNSGYIKTAVEDGHAEVLTRYERKLGDVRYYHIATFYDYESRAYYTRMMDFTEKIKLEERLAHKDTLSSVGQLTASIVHEIRNPMTTLKGFTQLLRVSATEESKRYLSVIDDEILRMESILSEMLNLSKPSKNKKEKISLRKLVSDLIRVIYPKASLEGITIIEKESSIVDDSIFGDAEKLKQAIFNLLKNALEAMPGDGKLTIEIEKPNDGEIRLSISDTGNGIDANQLNRIFVPYFTTRIEGTGLGLSFVLKTIEDHGGTISVESEVLVGTKFMLTFPTAIEIAYVGIVDEGALSESGWHY